MASRKLARNVDKMHSVTSSDAILSMTFFHVKHHMMPVQSLSLISVPVLYLCRVVVVMAVARATSQIYWMMLYVKKFG